MNRRSLLQLAITAPAVALISSTAAEALTFEPPQSRTELDTLNRHYYLTNPQARDYVDARIKAARQHIADPLFSGSDPESVLLDLYLYGEVFLRGTHIVRNWVYSPYKPRKEGEALLTPHLKMLKFAEDCRRSGIACSSLPISSGPIAQEVLRTRAYWDAEHFKRRLFWGTMSKEGGTPSV